MNFSWPETISSISPGDSFLRPDKVMLDMASGLLANGDLQGFLDPRCNRTVKRSLQIVSPRPRAPHFWAPVKLAWRSWALVKLARLDRLHRVPHLARLLLRVIHERTQFLDLGELRLQHAHRPLDGREPLARLLLSRP